MTKFNGDYMNVSDEIINAIKNLENCAETHGCRVDQCANGFISDTTKYLYESRAAIMKARRDLLKLLESKSE